MAEEEKTENAPEPAEEPTKSEGAPASEPAPEAPPPEPAPQAQNVKQWCMFVHLSALAGYVGIPFGWILGPLIIWLIKKDEIAEVNQHGKEALNFQISLSIYAIVALPLICLGGLGIIVLVALGIFDLVCIIIAAVKAADGQFFKYPITIRFIK
jgi:uncharacterized Tic20 family protein